MSVRSRVCLSRGQEKADADGDIFFLRERTHDWYNNFSILNSVLHESFIIMKCLNRHLL